MAGYLTNNGESPQTVQSPPAHAVESHGNIDPKMECWRLGLTTALIDGGQSPQSLIWWPFEWNMPRMKLIRRIFFLVVGFCHLVGAETVPTPAPITRLAGIRQMQREVASKSLPVSVAGVVTWCSPGRLSGGFVIDQDGAGVFVIADIDLSDGRKCPGPEVIRSLAMGDKVRAIKLEIGFAGGNWYRARHEGVSLARCLCGRCRV